MAKKIAVYGVSGTPESGDIKKSVAQLLVRRLLAFWVVENVSIQRVTIREARPISSRNPLPSLPYIPEKMPSVELPGLRFIPPPNWIAWPLPVYA